MVFVSQSLGAFKVPSVSRLFSLAIALLLVVVAPIGFFAYALTVVQKVSEPLSVRNVVWVLYWVTPVSGFQQLWLFIAWCAKWADFGSYVPPTLSSIPVRPPDRTTGTS